MISYKNQTIYVDAPKKIFWLYIGYFTVISQPENPNYEIIFFQIGRNYPETYPIIKTSIISNEWSAVFQEEGKDYIYEVK